MSTLFFRAESKLITIVSYFSYLSLNLHTARRIYPMHTDRHARAHTVDPDQTPQNATSDQDLHCLSVIHEFSDIRTGSKMDLF